MKATQRVTKIITLELNHEEAEWLKAIVQNPINVAMKDEHDRDEMFRHRFFKALNEPVGI